VDEKEENKKTLKELEDWAENFQKAQQVAPFVEKAIEQKKWETETMDTMPEAATDIPLDRLYETWRLERANWTEILPPMPRYDVNLFPTGVAINTTSAVTLYDVVNIASEIKEAASWANRQKTKYSKIHEDQNRIEEVKRLLQKLDPAREGEFEEAEQAYRVRRLGAGQDTAVGIAMRNVLEHVKGNLFEVAKEKPSEQKIMWSVMAERLANGGPNSPAHQTLLNLESDWKSLHTRFTEISKNLDSGVATDLESAFVQAVDFLFGLLSLINPNVFEH